MAEDTVAGVGGKGYPARWIGKNVTARAGGGSSNNGKLVDVNEYGVTYQKLGIDRVEFVPWHQVLWISPYRPPQR